MRAASSAIAASARRGESAGGARRGREAGGVERELRAHAGVGQPGVDVRDGCGRRRHGRERRLTQASIASRRARASRRRARVTGGGGVSEPAPAPATAEVGGRDERLHSPPPALAQRVDEVERRPAAEPVPPRLPGDEGQREVLGQIAGVGAQAA